MRKLLIVEDEPIIRMGIRTMYDWEKKGFLIVDEAGDGEEGLEMIRKYRPDLVITDIRMPRMDGLHMLEEALREQNFDSILLTGYGEFEYAKQAIRLGVKEYLLKPLNEEELDAALARLYHDIPQDGVEEVRERYLRHPEADNRYVETAFRLIAGKCGERLNVEESAREMGISGAYFTRIFKKATGRTFSDVLNDWRIQCSLKRLAEPGIKLYEVADALGFCDYKHFSMVFKRYTGKSPSEYLRFESEEKLPK